MVEPETIIMDCAENFLCNNLGSRIHVMVESIYVHWAEMLLIRIQGAETVRVRAPSGGGRAMGARCAGRVRSVMK